MRRPWLWLPQMVDHRLRLNRSIGKPIRIQSRIMTARCPRITSHDRQGAIRRNERSLSVAARGYPIRPTASRPRCVGLDANAPISGWRGKSIHINTRTTAIPLHGIVRICDSLRLVILPPIHFRLNRIAGIRVGKSLLVKQWIVLVLERRAPERQPRVLNTCY